METSNRSLKQRVYSELKEFFIIALYLYVVFALLLVYRSVILDEEHISHLFHGFALINALAFAKVVLIGEALRLGERANERPLIYPTLLKSALFAILLAVCKILEDAAVGLYRGKSFAESIADFGGGSWKAILTYTALMAVLFVPFFGFTELRRVLGKGKLAQIFFHRRDAFQPVSGSGPALCA